MRPSRFLNEIPFDLIKKHQKQSVNKSLKNSNLKYSSEPQTNKTEIKIGNQVYHKIFGYGILKKIEGSGEDAKLTIKFSGNHEKKLIQKYANLITK